MRACACACVPVPACACVRVAGVWAWACVRVGVCPRACGAGSDHSAVYKQAPRCRARRARRRLEQAQAGAGCRRRADHKQAMQYHCRAGDHAAGGRAGRQTANNPPAFRPLCSRRPSGQVYAKAGRYTGQAGTGSSGQAADAGAAPGGRTGRPKRRPGKADPAGAGRLPGRKSGRRLDWAGLGRPDGGAIFDPGALPAGRLETGHGGSCRADHPQPQHHREKGRAGLGGRSDRRATVRADHRAGRAAAPEIPAAWG